jgi:transposase-like protein
MGKDKTSKTPKVFVTDGLPAYHDAFKKEFWTLKNPRIKHVKEIHLKSQVVNNNIQD